MREVKRDRPMAVPTKFLVTIGGFLDGRCEVRWRRGKLWYRHDRIDGSEMSMIPSATDWERFWTAMDQIEVWSWKARYDTEILDGEQWTVAIRHGSQRIQCYGSNAYPGGHDRETAQPFQEFLAAVSALTRRPFGQAG